MLTKVEVYDRRNNMLSLPLDGVGTSFKVRDIDGLGPPKATLSTLKRADIDGEAFQAIQGGARNIVLTLGLEPNFATESPASLRQVLYGYFMSKATVRMRFYSTNLPTVEITGYVETCDPSIFSPETQMKISIMCLDPYFRAVDETVVNGLTTNIAEVTQAIAYEGTVETGFKFVLTADRALTSLVMMNFAPEQEVFSLNYSIVMPAVEWFTEFNSEPGDKYIQIRRTYEIWNQLHVFEPSSTWLLLKPGENLFRASVLGTPDLPWEITYRAKFGGL